MKKGAKPSKGKKSNGKESIELLSLKVTDFDLGKLKSLERFDQLPLSAPTLKGLRDNHYVKLTDIQRECIVPALKNSDILGAARTGSGKTLAFLVPVLEKLYREQWNNMDGLGAIVITPTRELALQIFEVLRKIGKYHSFSAGLLIGGKDWKAEKDRVGGLNILVCTPGRLLQHMDESPAFDANNLQVLVLDEADRILDMGFKKTVDSIVKNLSPERQSLLFSATQTKSVGDLARLSLADPKYISVDDVLPHATPKGLEQYYTICELQDKLDNIWSFLRSHTKSKILVFISSSKQVRYIYEAFRRLQPGIPLLHLHGRQKQTARIDITQKFSRSRASCLLATDVVARGIDFPEVDWVVQLDCPEDSATYIHRVGRSARAGKSGRALLFLTPNEEPFINKLESRKVPIQKLTIREKKKHSIQSELQAQCFQDPELKYLAQKAFISYVRSVYVQKDKSIFNVQDLPLDAFAESLGLASAPNIKINANAQHNETKNLPRALQERPAEKPDRVRTKYDRMFERQNQNVLSEHYQKLSKADEDDVDDFMTVKRQGHDLEETMAPLLEEPTSKRAAKKALSKKHLAKAGNNPSKIVFDDEGKPHTIYEFQDEGDFHRAGDAETQRTQFLSGEADDMLERDVDDKAVVKERRQEKKRRRKEMERLARAGEQEESEVEVRLPSPEPSDSEREPEKPPKRSRVDHEMLEVEAPETLEDLEALSSRLLQR